VRAGSACRGDTPVQIVPTPSIADVVTVHRQLYPSANNSAIKEVHKNRSFLFEDGAPQRVNAPPEPAFSSPSPRKFDADRCATAPRNSKSDEDPKADETDNLEDLLLIPGYTSDHHSNGHLEPNLHSELDVGVAADFSMLHVDDVEDTIIEPFTQLFDQRPTSKSLSPRDFPSISHGPRRSNPPAERKDSKLELLVQIPKGDIKSKDTEFNETNIKIVSNISIVIQPLVFFDITLILGRVLRRLVLAYSPASTQFTERTSRSID
jgi:hypothetical protein